jgi:phosphomannomutase
LKKQITFTADNFTESTIKDYIDQMAEKFLFNSREQNAGCPPITYTAMHGVGYPFVVRAMAIFGFPPLIPVKA